jgi:hypothetical protein
MSDQIAHRWRNHAELAWAAGLFEGEGHIAWNKASVHLEMNMTDLDVLERFRDIVGVGSINPKKVKDGNKPMWRWLVSGKPRVQIILMDFIPWFGAHRKERAEESLRRLEQVSVRARNQFGVFLIRKDKVPVG